MQYVTKKGTGGEIHEDSDVDPVLAEFRIQGSVPRTTEDI